MISPLSPKQIIHRHRGEEAVGVCVLKTFRWYYFTAESVKKNEIRRNYNSFIPSQIPLEPPHRIPPHERVVVHPDVAVLLGFRGFKVGGETQEQTLLRQLLVAQLRTLVGGGDGESRGLVDGPHRRFHLVDILPARSGGAQRLVGDFPLIDLLGC